MTDYLFAIPFFKYSVPDWEYHKKLILDKLPKNQYTDYMSTTNSQMPNYVNELTDAIDPILDEFKKNLPCPLVITNVWCELARKGDDHGVHNHGAVGYSSVLYVDFDPSCHKSTRFYCPFTEPMTGDLTHYEPDVQEGDIIFFPSYVLHEAPKNESDKTRVIISFNIMGANETMSYLEGTK